jgi:hypothetical protein
LRRLHSVQASVIATLTPVFAMWKLPNRGMLTHCGRAEEV